MKSNATIQRIRDHHLKLATGTLKLERLPEDRRDGVEHLINRRDAIGLVEYVPETQRAEFLLNHQWLLRDYGIFESCAFHAFICGNTKFQDNHQANLLLKSCDRDIIRLCGDELPRRPIHRLYRGIGNVALGTLYKRISWTTSPEVAAYFAVRNKNECWNQCNSEPAVIALEVPDKSIFFYSNYKLEHEVWFRFWRGCHPERIAEFPVPRLTPESEPLLAMAMTRPEVVMTFGSDEAPMFRRHDWTGWKGWKKPLQEMKGAP